MNIAGRDTQRMDWLAADLHSADFEYPHADTKCVLIIEWPRNVPVGSSLRANVDAALGIAAPAPSAPQEQPARTGTVADYPDGALVERAVRNARPLPGCSMVRWGCVVEAFGLGSTYAGQLCMRFGLNPEEMLRTPSHDDE